MNTEPRIESRAEQLYVAIRARLKMEEIPTILPPLIPELLEWVTKHGAIQTGPVFFNYLEMTDGMMTAEVGVPVKSSQTGDDRVHAGSLPAGKYAVYTHLGNYRELPEAHMNLELWAKENGIKLSSPCIESYPTDPEQEPDPKKWRTDILRFVNSKTE